MDSRTSGRPANVHSHKAFLKSCSLAERIMGLQKFQRGPGVSQRGPGPLWPQAGYVADRTTFTGPPPKH